METLQTQKEPFIITLPHDKTPINLQISDFTTFKQFVIKQKIGYYGREVPYFFVRSQILHIFLYFVLSINNPCLLDKLVDYEEKCRKRLAEYYIKNSMKIQIYEYSVVCAGLLRKTVQYCLHLNYFLVYGRLASVPYIESICNNKRLKTRRRQVMQMAKFTQDQTKSKKESRHLSKLSIRQSQNCRSFRKQLQGILNSESTKVGTKTSKWWENENFTQRDSTIYVSKASNSIDIKQEKPLTAVSERRNLSYIPNKIYSNENSAVIISMSGLMPKLSNMVRKRKFQDITLNWSKYSSVNKSACIGQQKDENEHLQREQRHTAKDFNYITQKIKYSNQHLDNVYRSDLKSDHQCHNKGKQNQFSTQKQVLNKNQQFFLAKVHLQEKNREEKRRESSIFENSFDDSEQQKNRPMTNLLRKSSSNDQIFKISTETQNQHVFGKFVMFHKRPLQKTQRYKEQYKKFMDTQFLDRFFQG